MDLGLEGRTLICTGAAGGIGRPTAELLAEEGARLLVVDREHEAVAELAAALPGGDHVAWGGDLRAPEVPAAIVERAVESFGRVDGLVHLAAAMTPCGLDEIDVGTWDLHQDVNVRASFLLARAAAASMARAGGGAVVLASSAAWLTGGRPDRLHYAVTKGAVTTMVRGLATALGPQGIRVNGIAPGMVDTPMMNAGIDAATRRALEEQAPLRRFAEPREVAVVIAFLVAPVASYVSGATVAVTGGQVLH
ncbi:MAG: SDR family NAD(P)-dependent oxidoreductase [Solirubrobacteraceae bacterium]